MTDAEKLAQKRARNKRNTDKRKAEMTSAAQLNGYKTWSAMLTDIKNAAKEGFAIVSKGWNEDE